MVDPSNTTYDVCIVGAGIAGSALAAYLGKSSLKVALVEKKWEEPDEIIGELLQPSGVEKLKEMGLSSVFEGIDAQPIKGYAIYLKDQPHQLSYPTDSSEETYKGYGFRYGRFVQGLRALSDGFDNVDHIKGRVESLIHGPEDEVTGVMVDNYENTPRELKARLTVISQGSLSVLRGQLNRAKSETKGFMLGAVLENCSLPFPNHGHVIMADPAPILAYPVGENKVRVLIDFPNELPVMKGEELKSYLAEVIMPQLPEVLRSRFSDVLQKEKLKGKPTHLLASRAVLKEGVVLLGDSLNMRHPVTGAGMTVALTDVKDLGGRLIALKSFDRFLLRSEIEKFYKKRHKVNATVNILAYALYSVFRHKILRKACFAYLKKGGKFAAEPMSLLSGISRNRSVLIKHFFAVGWLAVKQQLKPFPTPRKLKQSFGLIGDTFAIIVPLIRDEVPRVEGS